MGKRGRPKSRVAKSQKSYRFRDETLDAIREFAEQLEDEAPFEVEISDREVLEMLVHSARRLIDDGTVSLRDFFYLRPND